MEVDHLNPYTPLAFLPPDTAAQYEVSRYIYFSTLGAFCWDILANLPDDFKLVSKHQLALPTFAYFFSRIAAMSFLVTNIVFQVSSVPDCQALQVAIGWCYCAAASSTSFLFFLRVRAMFDQCRLVIFVFGFLWLCVLGTGMTVPFAIGGEHIGSTQYCINTRVRSFSSVGVIAPSVNDACVFIAVSWRVLTTVAEEEGFKGRLKSFLGRTRLPTLSKAVLQSGQQYYMITLGGNILAMAMILAPGIPPVYRAMFTSPNVALMNSMACRVYRNIKLRKFATMQSTTFQLGDIRSIALSPARNQCPRDGTTFDGDFTVSTSGGGIYVTRTVVRGHDPMTVMASRTDNGGEKRSTDIEAYPGSDSVHHDQK
jgi:hypothetical protein